MTNSSKFKVIFIWVTVIALTALLITSLIIKINKNKTFDSYSDIEKSSLMIKDIYGKNDSSYYVFIYSSKDEYDAYKKEELEEVVTKYATFAHRNSDATEIYFYDTSKFRKTEEFKTCALYLEEKGISISETPLLVLVTDGVVSSIYSTVGGNAGIEATLVNLMKTTTE